MSKCVIVIVANLVVPDKCLSGKYRGSHQAGIIASLHTIRSKVMPVAGVGERRTGQQKGVRSDLHFAWEAGAEIGRSDGYTSGCQLVLTQGTQFAVLGLHWILLKNLSTGSEPCRVSGYAGYNRSLVLYAVIARTVGGEAIAAGNFKAVIILLGDNVDDTTN